MNNMSHNHNHHHGHHHHVPESGLGSALLLNLVFTIIEFWGGAITNSTAILSDAVHDLGDTLALALTWYFQKLSKKGRTPHFTYGFRRLSVFAAVISSGVLLAGSTWVLFEAVPRFWQPEPVKSGGMLLLACLGIAANGLAFWRLNASNGPAEKAARLHLLEDVMGWVAVLLGSIVIYFTHWYWIDPLLSTGIALFILWQVVKNLRSFSVILLQGVPENLQKEVLITELKAVKGILEIHDLHLWTLDNQSHIMSFHAVMEEAEDALVNTQLSLKTQLKAVAQRHGVAHVTLELEFPQESCSSC